MKDFVRVMKALSDPSRVKVVKMLQQKPMCVCEIQAALGLAQPTVSRHLKVLEEAGLVDSSKDGLWVNYSLSAGGSPYAATLLGNLDLHTGMPVMIHNLLEAVRLLSNVCGVFVERCLEGLTADRERCEALVEQSLAMCTSLVPLIGYDRAAELAKETHRTGRTIRELALEQKLADPARLAAALDAAAMTRPQADQ